MKFSIGAMLLFVVVTLAHNLVFFRDCCFPSFDLGIYMEAVSKFSPSHLNPYLSTLGVGFLNDHWHPALLLAKPLTLFFPISTSLFLIEILFTVILGLLPLVVAKKGLLDPGASALITMYLFLNQRQFEASMAFPVHPAVWANALLFFAVVRLVVSRAEDPVVFAALFFAGFFGEQFSLALLGYSLIFCVVSTQAQKKRGLFMVFFSLVWVWFCLSGRALLLGPILHQSNRVATSFADFVGKYDWNLKQFSHFLKFFIEALPLLYFAFRSRAKIGSRLVLAAGIFGPLILGRILSGSFGHQYDTLSVCAMAAFAMLWFSSASELHLGNRALALSFAFFVALSFSKLERAYGVLSSTKLPGCVRSSQVALTNSERLDGLEPVMRKFAGSFSVGVASGNLVPNLVQTLSSDAKIYTLGMPIDPHPAYDWILVERGNCGDPWPWDEKKIGDYIHSVEADPLYRVVEESSCLFFAEKK